MRALCYAQTNIGSGRDNNEDNYYCNGTFKRDPAIPVAEAAAEQESRRLIYGVFDGMGGEANGEQAALLCAQTLHQCSSDEPFDALDFFRRANVAVCDMIAASGQIGGSTAATVHLTGNRAYCCNVGDSRAYRVGAERLERITRDHSVVEGLIESGNITAEQARTHPNRNLITRALGPEEHIECDVYDVTLGADERLLLCSDGLVVTATDEEMYEAVGRGDTPAESLEHLLELSKQRGAPDNVTAVLLYQE